MEFDNDHREEAEATRLLELTTRDPVRRAFGFGHALTYTIMTMAPLMVTRSLVDSSLGNNVMTRTAGFLISIGSIISGIAYGVKRQEDRGNDVYAAINVEFSLYAAQQTKSRKYAVLSALGAGLRNGLRKNGFEFSVDTVAGVILGISVAGSAGAKYIFDTGRSLCLDSIGKDASIATRQTYSEMCADWANYIATQAEAINLIKTTPRKESEAVLAVMNAPLGRKQITNLSL